MTWTGEALTVLVWGFAGWRSRPGGAAGSSGGAPRMGRSNRGGDRIFPKLVPGAASRDHVTLEGGGHFLQEDVGPRFAQLVADFVAQHPKRLMGLLPHPVDRAREPG